jgi:hypothetical protein
LTVVVLTNTSNGGGVAREIVDSLLKIESEAQP